MMYMQTSKNERLVVYEAAEHDVATYTYVVSMHIQFCIVLYIYMKHCYAAIFVLVQKH